MFLYTNCGKLVFGNKLALVLLKYQVTPVQHMINLLFNGLRTI